MSYSLSKIPVIDETATHVMHALSGPQTMPYTDQSPAKPIENNLATWVPRVAATGCMGLTFWLASRNDEVIKGAFALAFPFFGADPEARLHASYLVTNLISPLLIWTIEGNRAGNAMTPLAL